MAAISVNVMPHGYLRFTMSITDGLKMKNTISEMPVHIVEPYTIRRRIARGWRERLFSITPHVKYKYKHELVDVVKPDAIINDNGVLYMSAATFDLLKRKMKHK